VDSRSAISILALLPLVCGTGVHAQGPGANPADCMGAIFIKDSVMVCDRPGRGFGNILEIKENPATDRQWLEREHHSTWYMFRAPVKGRLTFDIVPTNVGDDIDFLLFDGAVPDFCEKVQEKQAVPVRSNISRNDRAIGSMCGLSKDADEEYVRSGAGNSYSKALEVEMGELLYLLVDYQDRPLDGYAIHLHYDAPPPALPVVEEPAQGLQIDIVDASTGKPLKALVTVEGMVFDSVVEAHGQSSYSFRMEPYRNLRISCLSKGYMLYSTNVDGTRDEEVDVRVELTPIANDAQVVLQDIHFVGNEERVMRSSEAALFLLLHFLEENPTTRVEIQGHVNGPTYDKNTKEFIELSTARARTVYNFLVINDVDPSRISYVGLGNSHMLYPDPKNKTESEANRRVEVRITHT
jgi:outer membrane protein OmpA-like peptidoglycan-associated protein